MLHIQVPSWRQVRRTKTVVNTRYDDAVFVWQASRPVWTHRFPKQIEKAENEAVLQGIHRIEREFGRSPDFIIAQNVLPAGRWAGLIKREYGVEFGTIEHFTFLERMLRTQYSEIERVYDDASFIAGVSNSVKDLLIGYLPEPMHAKTGVIGNVIGEEFQQCEPSLLPESTDEFRWLFVGPDQFKKGPELLHSVYSGLNFPNWSLTIVGDGKFEPIRNDPELQEHVNFQSNLSRKEMVALMQSHHALISTSHIETFGMAILEMMSLGRPVVATRSGGPQDFVTPECGILTPVGATDELQKAVESVQSNYDKYSPQKIRDHALQRYGQRIYAERVLNLIDVFSPSVNGKNA